MKKAFDELGSLGKILFFFFVTLILVMVGARALSRSRIPLANTATRDGLNLINKGTI